MGTRLNIDYKRHLQRLEVMKQNKKKRKKKTVNLNVVSSDTQYDNNMMKGQWPTAPTTQVTQAQQEVYRGYSQYDTMEKSRYVIENAKDSMRSFIRAYSTYPPQLKWIFYVSNLDFSQVAECFFLDRGSRISSGHGKESYEKQKRFKRSRHQQDRAQKLTKKRNLPHRISEFAS